MAATPKFAPSLIPKMEGPAKGFRKSVWSNSPLTASDAPAMMAVIAWGMRDCSTICSQALLPVSFPDKMSKMVDKGIDTEP